MIFKYDPLNTILLFLKLQDPENLNMDRHNCSNLWWNSTDFGRPNPDVIKHCLLIVLIILCTDLLSLIKQYGLIYSSCPHYCFWIILITVVNKQSSYDCPITYLLSWDPKMDWRDACGEIQISGDLYVI